MKKVHGMIAPPKKAKNQALSVFLWVIPDTKPL